MKVWLYIRCIIRNRFTLLGYAFVLFGLLIFVAFNFGVGDVNMWLCAYFSSMLGLFFLMATDCGRQTYDSYQRTMENIKTIDPRKILNLYKDFYCNRVGIELALQDAKEKKLIKKPPRR